MGIKKDLVITEKKLLLVEGKDEIEFFEEFLKEKKLDKIQIIPCGGKFDFKKKFPVIKDTRGFDELTSLAVIHDADTNVQSTFQRICSVLNTNDLNSPQAVSTFAVGTPKVGVFIIPDGNNQGMLESLCLSTVKSESTMGCIDSFMDCIKQEATSAAGHYKFPKNIYKAKCRAFLSAMEEDTPSLGVATKKGYWDLNSSKLKPLLDFLKQI